MKVWVVMGNDYPDAVFDSEAAAKEYCEAKKIEPAWLHASGHSRIHWRSYEFELRH